MDREKEIKKVVDKIVDYYNPEKVILFGSSTYSYTHPDSDIDLLVITKSDKNQSERHREIDNLFIDREYALDILVFTPDEVDRRVKMGDSFMSDILEKGTILYDKR